MTQTVFHLIAAARPNFMKIAPLYHAFQQEKEWANCLIIHTGQHYDYGMSEAFFADLGIPAPDINLNVGSGSHAEQTAAVMVAYERFCRTSRPDWVIVVGDVNSTLACSLVTKKLNFNLAHLEAGLRSGDRTMPEEINRVVTDVLADRLWTPSEDADENLLREGISAERIARVGNVMIDSYEFVRDRIESLDMIAEFGLPLDYAVATFHRPSNVDDQRALTALVESMIEISTLTSIVFPVHPRTANRIEEFGLSSVLNSSPNIRLIGPLGYIRFMALVIKARFVITDSGGIQEETTYLDIPCLTLRDTTERPITISQGTNRLVKPENLLHAARQVQQGSWPRGRRPELWDGRAAVRVIDDLKNLCQK